MINPQKITVLLLFLASCESLTEVEIPREPDMLVIGSLFNPDSVLSVRVTKTFFVLEGVDRRDRNVSNAKVSLFEAGSFVRELNLATNKLNFETRVYTSEFIPSQGTEYSIEVSAPGFEPIEAYGTIPTKIKIDEVVLAPTLVAIEDGDPAIRAEITFTDPKGENYYELLVNFVYESGNDLDSSFFRQISPMPLSPDVSSEFDLLIDDPYILSLYYDDRLFDGSRHKLTFFIKGFNVNSYNDKFNKFALKIDIILRHISKEHYQYGITLRLQEEISDDPFAEPVQVFGNVNGGLGIFAGFNQDSIRIFNPNFNSN